MGKLYLMLVAIMVFISVSLSGIFVTIPNGEEVKTEPAGYTCCDTGNGDDCQPITENGFLFKGDQYSLLKSDILLAYNESADITVEHMDPARSNRGEDILTPDGRRIFLNRQDKMGSEVYPECIGRGQDNKGYDRLYGLPDSRNTGPGSSGKGCYAIPDELLIYVCRKDSVGDCFAPDKGQGKLLTGELKFDIYIRQRNVDENGIQKVIKDCYRPQVLDVKNEKILFRVSPGGQPNLQLRTFKFVNSVPPISWLTPYCKPAIYLYPEQKSEINVSVFPQGKLMLTIPKYPVNGWNVVAEPNGVIHYGTTAFDYLYYEASLPDKIISRPKAGYVIPYAERTTFLTELVTKLGLNEKETQQFVEYWAPILPESPYYFVGIVPEAKLHEIAPLIITPKPKNLIRVTLYFQALTTKESVTEPVIKPVSRNGYTVVEWGGIYKQDKEHPFSCFM